MKTLPLLLKVSLSEYLNYLAFTTSKSMKKVLSISLLWYTIENASTLCKILQLTVVAVFSAL